MRLQTTATIPAIGTAGRVACPLAFAAIVALSLLASPVGAADTGPASSPPSDAAADRRTETKADARDESKPESKAESKGDAKGDPKGDGKADPKANAKGEPKPEPKADAKVEPKTEPKAEPKAESKADAKTEPKAEPKTEPKTEPKADAQAETKAEAGTEDKPAAPAPDAPKAKEKEKEKEAELPLAGRETLAKDGVRRVIGAEVKSGKSAIVVATIANVLVDPEGRIIGAVLDYGGFMGVGKRRIAVAWSLLTFETGKIVLALTRDQLKEFPDYRDGEDVVLATAPAPPN